MQKLTSPSQLVNLSPPYRPPTLNALKSLPPIAGPDPTDRGFVVFVEEDDTVNDVNRICARNLETSLEGAFLEGNCLIGVVLWGNSGEGVTIVCPNVAGYAEEVGEVLREHL
jgi:hypothetical protein